MEKPVVPNNYVYQRLMRTSGPQSALGTDYDMNTDSDPTPTIFAFTAPRPVFIARINIEILDGGIRNDRFAGIAAGVLSNGCLFRVVDNNGGMRLDFLNGVPIVRNADFSVLAGVDAIVSQAAGDDLLPIRFSIFKASMNRPLYLRKNERIEWHNRDDLSSISIFRMMVQGMFEKA